MPDLLAQSTSHIPGLVTSHATLRRRKRARNSELRLDTLDPVRGVDVLDQRDLVAGGGALAGDDGGVGEEELPDLRGA